MKRWPIGVLAMLVLVSCGGSTTTVTSVATSSSSGTATTQDIPTLARQFSFDLSQANAELTMLKTSLSDTDIARDDGLFTAAAATFSGFAKALRFLAVPASMAQDTETAAAKADAVTAAFTTLARSTSAAEVLVGKPALQGAENDLHAALVVLEHDLGLPPSTPSQ